MATTSFTKDFNFKNKKNIKTLQDVLGNNESGYFDTPIKNIDKLEMESQLKVFKKFKLDFK